MKRSIRMLTRSVALLMPAVLCGLFPSPALAVSPPLGTEAPSIVLNDLDGRRVDIAEIHRSLVLVFGDPTHDGVRSACADVLATLDSPSHAGDPVTPILIVMHDADTGRLKQDIAAGRLPATILLDPERKAFGAYRVLVMPTVVVVDPEGNVQYAMSGPVQHFSEKLSAALLLCAGRMTQEQFRNVISPDVRNAATEATRADRLVHLGQELVRHRLYELAEARFREAQAIAPDNIAAKLGIAGILVRTGRLDEAQKIYEEIAATDKDSVHAAIGLATVEAYRGGDALNDADFSASELVAKYPSDPEVRFLMGIVYERKGNCLAAMAEFKYAAELLLSNPPPDAPSR